MKRKVSSSPRPYTGARWGDTLQNLTTNQLAWIGAVAMLYNDAEDALHQLFSSAIHYYGNSYEISKRINGTDGLVSIIKTGADIYSLDDDLKKAADYSLAHGFSDMKTYRDAVVHSRVLDVSKAIGEYRGSRNQRQYVLLSEEALEGVCNRLEQITRELSLLSDIYECARRIKFDAAIDDQHKARLGGTIRDATFQLLKYQTRRRSLRPLPQLPAADNFHTLMPHRAAPPRRPPGV